MNVHLVDGTFELFRAYYGSPPSTDARGKEVGAARGLARSMLALLGERDVTHVAIAFDHVIESFRNDLYPGYKTGEGIDPASVRTVRSGRGRVPRARDRDVADDRVRVRRRARDGGGALRRVDRPSSASSCARPTRISRNACRASASCASIACGARGSTSAASSRSSACSLRRFPIGSRSSATAPTAIPAFRAGARSPRPPCSACTSASRRFPRMRAAWRVAGARRGRARREPGRASHRGRSCSGSSRRCAPTCRSPESLDELRWRGPDVAALARAGGAVGRRRDSCERARRGLRER